MQQVDRKRRKEKKHGRRKWVLLGIAAAALSVTAAVLLNREAPKPEVAGRVETGGTLSARQATELVSMTVTRKGKDSWTLTRDAAGGLHLNGQDDWEADSAIADLYQDAVTNLVYADIVTEDPAEYRDKLDEFGLDDPGITVEARFYDGERLTFRIGDRMPVAEGWYYMTVDGDDRLFAVSAALAQDLGMDPQTLHPVEQPDIYAVLLDRITLAGADGTVTAEWRLRGQVTDRDAGTNWEITVPIRYPADEESVKNLKSAAEELRMGSWAEQATEESLARYGLDHPAYTLTLHMAAGSTGTVSPLGVFDVVERPESTVTLAIADGSHEMLRYVRFGDGIYSVSYVRLAALLEADPAETAARYVAAMPLNSVESLRIEQDGTAAEYVLSRTGETDAETAEEIILCEKNGEEFPYDVFAAAYERLLTVTVSGILPEGTVRQEPYARYVFRSVSGVEHTVELAEWDGMHDTVTIDGETRFYLIRGGMTFSAWE